MLNVSEKTHRGMLPQSPALELVSVDKLRVSTKRGINAGKPAAGVQRGRGETVGKPIASRRSDTAAGGNAHTLVAVLSKDKRPLDPCTPARARELLAKGRAVVVRVVPFVIRLKDRTVTESVTHPHVVKVDPGSKFTGLAVARVDGGTHGAVWLGELIHRGLQIKLRLSARAALRRGRRSRNLRYRAPRFLNRTKPKGWLPPSLRHRMETTTSWVDRLSRWFPVAGVWVESVKFDTQALVNPEISGVEYQQSTLAGFEVREYLLEKFGRQCAYCDAVNVPLNIDHVHPRSRGGSNRVSNLVLACVPCNERKSNQPVEQFVTDPVRLSRIQRRLKVPLRDAAAVNTTRKSLVNLLRGDVVTGTGGRTKFNRSQFGVAKTHALDALCVGELEGVSGTGLPVLVIKATGRGSYARTRSDRYGFPRLILTRKKKHFGFQTGDLVKAVVPSGVKAGTHTGRVAVRATGSFNIVTRHGTVQGISHRHVRFVQRGDGFGYER